MSGQPPYGAQPSAPPMQPTYPSVQQPRRCTPASPAPRRSRSRARGAGTPSTTDDLKAVAKGVAGVARLVKSAAARGPAAVKAGAASASASSASAHHVQASHHPSAPPRYGRAAPYAAHVVAAGACDVPRGARVRGGTCATPPPRREKEQSTCWCGFRDDPDMAPARAAARRRCFVRRGAHPGRGAVGGAAGALLRLLMLHGAPRTRRPDAARGGVQHAAAGTRDVVDAGGARRKWVWLDNANGNCWVCELPVSKQLRAPRGGAVPAVPLGIE